MAGEILSQEEVENLLNIMLKGEKKDIAPAAVAVRSDRSYH